MNLSDATSLPLLGHPLMKPQTLHLLDDPSSIAAAKSARGALRSWVKVRYGSDSDVRESVPKARTEPVELRLRAGADAPLPSGRLRPWPSAPPIQCVWLRSAV